MNVGEMRRFYRLMPREFWLGMLTLGGVIIFDVLPGLIIGVLTSILLVVYRASRPQVSVLGRSTAVPGAYDDLQRHPDTAVAIPGVLIVRPNAELFYANAESVRDRIEHAVEDAADRIDTVVIDWMALTSSTSPAPTSCRGWPRV